MTAVRARENTFKVDLSNFPKRPSFEEIHAFVHEKIGLTIDQVLRLQMNHAQNCAHVKCRDLKIAQDAVDQHNGRHELEVNKTKFKVRLMMDDGGVDVKIHDLSENIRNEEIIDFLKQYGEVISIKELVWGDTFAFKGISSGIRVAKMVLHRHIKSFVTIQGEESLVSYRNQPQYCKHCTNPSHPGLTCVENKKLIGQKADLNNRLNAAQGKTTYAGVLNQRTAAATLMPEFIGTNLNELNASARSPRAHAVGGERELTIVSALPSGSMDGGRKDETEVDTVAGADSAVIVAADGIADVVAADGVAVDAVVDTSAEDVATTTAAMTVPDEAEIEMTEQTLQQVVDAQHKKKITVPCHVSAFKIPLPNISSNPLSMEISESESNESESGSFSKGMRTRGRSKKQKFDSSV